MAAGVGSTVAWSEATAGQEPGAFRCLDGGRGPRIALDCGPVSGYGACFRRNDERLGAINRAPTRKTYPYQEGAGG